MEKIDGKSMSIELENVERLKELFPNAVSEGKIDFDVLRTMLGDEVDASKEKYQFTWSGKAESIKLAQRPSASTLRPCKEKSKDWDTTENIYIEGDNLSVLKQLQKTYFNTIKMMYIDPPYNTGNDCIYRDDYSDSVENYRSQTNQALASNPETNGRFHSDWLSMMYPRLILCRNLLSETGVVFISIDEHEVHNLLKIVNEVFGENNVDMLVWRKNDKQGNTKQINRFKNSHEYIVVGYRNKKNTTLGKMKVLPNWITTSNPDCDPRGNWMSGNISKEEEKSRKDSANYYSVTTPTGRVVTREWFITKSEYEKLANDIVINSKGEKVSRIYYASDGSGVPRIKRFENEEQEFYFDSIIDSLGSFTEAHKDLKELFDGKDCFPTPKPVKLIEELVRISTSENDIVMDFFAGSSTTAHAVMALNSSEGSRRKFIMVQIPELTEENSDAYIAGFGNICEIGEERIRRAGESIKRADLLGRKVDVGFKVFAVDTTNINQWDNRNEYNESSLFDTAAVFKANRSKEDILYEIMLKYGIFNQPANEIKVNGKTMFRVGQRHMIVCLEDKIDDSDIAEICKLEPRVVVFKEDGFKDDNAKINAEYNLKKSGVEDVKCI